MADNDWWRGSGMESRTNARMAVGDEVRADRESVLHDQMFVGAAAYRIIKGVQQRPEAVEAVLTQMVVDCEAQLREHTRTLLQADDPASPAARKAHFEARVAAGVVNLLNDYVRRAASAEATFNNAPGD